MELISYRTGRYGWCLPYQNLGWYKNTSISFRFKYRPYQNHSGYTGANTEFQPVTGYQAEIKISIVLL